MEIYSFSTDVSPYHQTESRRRCMNSPQASRYPLAVIRKLELEELDTRKDMVLVFICFHERDSWRMVGRLSVKGKRKEEREKRKESWEMKNVVGIYVGRGDGCTVCVTCLCRHAHED